MIGIMLVIVVTMILAITQPNESFIDLLYEATSAFGTVGTTTGVTQRLNTIGRNSYNDNNVSWKSKSNDSGISIYSRNKVKQSHKYPEGKILIG